MREMAVFVEDSREEIREDYARLQFLAWSLLVSWGLFVAGVIALVVWWGMR